jgi:hypothetical protein
MVPFSWIKIRRITLQVKKQQYFALVMTAATEVKFKKNMFKPERFLLQIQSQGLQTGWNPTPYTPHSVRLGYDDALCVTFVSYYLTSLHKMRTDIHTAVGTEIMRRRKQL